MDLIAMSNEDTELNCFMEKIWNSKPMAQPFSELQSQILYKRIVDDERFSGAMVQRTRAYPHKFWHRFSIAATILITLSVGVFFILQRTKGLKFDEDHLITQDVAPGSSKAVLTLGNGRKVILNDVRVGTLAKQAGITISKAADGRLVYHVSPAAGLDRTGMKMEYNTISTPRGGQYQVNLPDGTTVWLNSASSLKFPTEFKFQDKREVELTGEAYFEVAHDKKQPFVVKTNKQEVEVLGTHFNINSYDDEPETKTTLLEGSIRVSPLSFGGKGKVILKPGQQAILNKNMQVVYAEVGAAIAWKNGFFHFKDADLYTVLRQLARWYDVEVIYQIERTNDEFVGDIPRTVTLATALKILNLGGVQYKIDGKKIIVTK
ncbi:fec operon regulator FecR [compost metagenome]